MKTIFKLIPIAVIATLTMAFSTPVKEKVAITSSQINWKGEKVTGTHTGTIALKSGYFLMENNQLTGGMFVVDMTSITVTDLDGGMKTKLEGHLKSDDFFGVNNYPEATLTITDVAKKGEAYKVTANLKIKENTHPIHFTLAMSNGKATTNLKIDRSKYDVRYGSKSFFDNLGDRTIMDIFELDITLNF